MGKVGNDPERGGRGDEEEGGQRMSWNVIEGDDRS